MNNKFKNKKTQKGFTLVELAIVLVIIGLIVSSVLVGQDLIKAAQLRATVRQYNDFQVGVNTFIGKYNGIPGDILAANATSFGLTGAGGDGNGTITDVANATTTGSSTNAKHLYEIASFWSHLTTPGKELIQGTFRGPGCTTACSITSGDIPSMKVGGNGWAAYGNSGTNYFVAGASFPNPSVASAYTATASFTPQDAYNIDSKIDDGIPNSGNVTGGITSAAGAAALSTTGAACGTTAYVFATTTNACTLMFLMQTF